MKICITGAGGFIGSHLTEAAVRAGHDVRALVRYNSRSDEGQLAFLAPDIRKSVEVIAGDIRDPDGMDALLEDIEGVFHLAALIGIPYSYVAPSSYIETNVRGTLNLLNASRRSGVRVFVNTSTSEVYGTAQYVPIDEAHPLVGQSPYSASKIAADKVAESCARAFDLPVITIRPFNTYGPRQSMRAIIPTMVAQLLDPAMKQINLGTQKVIRDFTFVTDTAGAFLKSVVVDSLPVGETINLGTGEGVSIAQLHQQLEQLSGISKPIKYDVRRVRPEKSEVMRLISDNKKARDLLAWTPTVSLRDGLSRVLDYMASSPPANSSVYHI